MAEAAVAAHNKRTEKPPAGKIARCTKAQWRIKLSDQISSSERDGERVRAWESVAFFIFTNHPIDQIQTHAKLVKKAFNCTEIPTIHRATYATRTIKTRNTTPRVSGAIFNFK